MKLPFKSIIFVSIDGKIYHFSYFNIDRNNDEGEQIEYMKEEKNNVVPEKLKKIVGNRVFDIKIH